MAFNRATSPEAVPAPGELTARMVGIGMSFAAKADADADIESTLVHASAVGMDEGDLRVLAVLTTWLGVHHTHVNADRLVRLVGSHPSERARAYWAAIAGWLRKDRRLARLAGVYEGARVELLPTGTAFQVQRRGEDERFTGSKLLAPKGTLRDRPEDVLSPEVLIRRHAGYRNRVLMGPSFRADVWTALEHAPGLSIADVARKASCSFATAWQAAQDFRLLRAAEAATPGWPARRGRRHGSASDG
ncbi:MAG: hypothetical protein IPG04_35800 [Polyangiaceae bacterium]|jgi:hypothetical protein|nr:hypothetical protein [Polyangiaceae bacterium]